MTRFTPTAELVEILGRAVRDREYLVRYHAANTLLRFAGSTTEIGDHALFAKISGPQEGEDTPADLANRWEAADALTAAARRKLV